MWSRLDLEVIFSGQGDKLAMGRPTPVIFAAQKQAQAQPGQVAAIRPVNDGHVARHPNRFRLGGGQAGDRNAPFMAFRSPACCPLTSHCRASFVPGRLCVSKGTSPGRLPLRAALFSSSAIAKPEQQNSGPNRPCRQRGRRQEDGWACNLGTEPNLGSLAPAHEGQPLETTPTGSTRPPLSGLELP